MVKLARSVLGMLLLALPGSALAQQVTVTATITDSDNIAWAGSATYGGTYAIQLVSPTTGAPIPPGQAYRTDSGATVTTQYSGNMSGSGGISVAIDPVNAIRPSATWKFTICPGVSSGSCGSVTIPVSASGSLSTQLSAIAPAPRISGGIGSYAYADVEVVPIPNNNYYNTTSAALRCYGSAWGGCGGSGAGDTITSPNASLVVGGSPTATTLDLNLSNPNAWTGTQTYSSIINLGNTAGNNRVAYCFGDSTMAGTGATIAQNVLCSRLAADTLGTTQNWAVGGTFENQIVAAEVLHMIPATPLNGSAPPAVYLNGGINDANTATSAGAEAIYTDALNAALAFEANYANIIFASAATKTGTWTADTTDVPLNAAITATAEKATTTGATLTFSVPSGNGKIAIYWEPLTAGTGTFTVGIDGTNQTSACSGSTTFTNSSCQSVFPNSTSIFREEFAVAAGTHSVVVTTATAGQSVIILGVDTNPANTVGQPLMIMSGVIYQLADASSAATAAYNALASTVTSTLIADHLNVVFANVRGTNPGVNSTTDMSATSGIGGVSPLHPNDAGYLHWAETIENAAPVNSFFPGTSSPTTLYQGTYNLNPNALIPAAAAVSPLNAYYIAGSNFAEAGLAYNTAKSTYVNALITGSSFGFEFMHCGAATPPVYSACTSQLYVDSSGNETLLGSQSTSGILNIGTTFTVSGCSASLPIGGATAGKFQLGAASCSFVITMAGATGLTSANGWSCYANDRTSIAYIQQTASDTHTATFAVPAGAANLDIVNFGCMGY